MIRFTVESAPSQPITRLLVSEEPSENVTFTESLATLMSVRVFEHCTSIPVRSKVRNFSRNSLMRFDMDLVLCDSAVSRKKRS